VQKETARHPSSLKLEMLAVSRFTGPRLVAVRFATFSGEGSIPSRSILNTAPSVLITPAGLETNSRLLTSQSAKRIVSQSHSESKAHNDLSFLLRYC